VKQFAKLQADRAWLRWGEQQVRQANANQTRLESAGEYLGYVAEIERHQIRLLSGEVVDAESITNAGLSEGDPVVVNRAGGVRFKAMPR
jgi:hypothetical protein